MKTRALLVVVMAATCSLGGAAQRPPPMQFTYGMTADGLMEFDLTIPPWLWSKIEGNTPLDLTHQHVTESIYQRVNFAINNDLERLKEAGGCPNTWELYRTVKMEDHSMIFFGECVDDFRSVRR